MEHLVNLTKSLVSLAESIPEPECGHFEVQAQVVLSDAFEFLAATEKRLNETMRVIEQLQISADTPPALASWELTAKDLTSFSNYQNALDLLYASDRVSHRFHLFLRLIERAVVDPVVGPVPAVSLESSIRKLVQSESTSGRRKTALRNTLVSRIADALRDIPKARKDLSTSFHQIRGQCLKEGKRRNSSAKPIENTDPNQNGLIERETRGKTGRRPFSAQEKVNILRLRLVEGMAVSDLCREYRISPSLFFKWQRTFFENGAKAFGEQRNSIESRRPKKMLPTRPAPPM